MGTPPLQVKDTVALEVASFRQLLSLLIEQGYRVIGPTIRENAIVLDRLHSAEDLPVGWIDEQDPGKYRLTRCNDPSYFGCSVGPQSWKQFLRPPIQKLWHAERKAKGFSIIVEPLEAIRYAFIGVRACELQALEIQDRIFLDGAFRDTDYQSRRDAFLLAVNCSRASRTCFCSSMGSGPKAVSGFDIALTEILMPRHYFLAEVGTQRGGELLMRIPRSIATPVDREAAVQVCANTTQNMGRSLDINGLKEDLCSSYDDPHWDRVAARCLSCGNCTLVCPTCFCTTIQDRTDLTGHSAVRWKEWDSCFSTEFSYIHGGSVRATVKSRYRQWLTHKLVTWNEQFDIPGCVGCGRCITWCPAGIDLTEEARLLHPSKTSARETL